MRTYISTALTKYAWMMLTMASLHLSSAIYAQPFPEKVKKVLFLGNSITYAGKYIADIEAYFMTHYPNQSIQFINMGLPSETVSGLSEPGHANGEFLRPDLHTRLDRVFSFVKPDFIFACYGMNDGIYMPFSEKRFSKFKEGVNWLHNIAVAQGIPIVHLTPPIFDEHKGKKEGYSAVLDRYADWLLDQGKTRGWEVIDIHYPMKRYLDAHRKVDQSFSLDGFALAHDGVHPGDVGHWMMAKEVLLYLGETKAASAPDVIRALGHPNGSEILKLVVQKQGIMKDAGLTAAGHDRPGMKTGLPIEEARAKAKELETRIRELIKK